MNMKARIARIARKLNRPNLVIRFCDPDGSYPEAEADKQKGNTVIKVMAEGIKGERLKELAQ